MKKILVFIMAIAVALLVGCEAEPEVETDTGVAEVEEPLGTPEVVEQSNEAADLLSEAGNVLAQLKSDPESMSLLQQARGVLLVPDYGKAAAVVGARGGEGVLYVKRERDGKWHGPAFYDLGGLSIGAQVGVEAGQIAMLLMSDAAVEQFMQANNFSLNAGADITIVDASAVVKGTADPGDIVLWADTEGAFAGADISVTDVNYDEEENRAYWQTDTTPMGVTEGQIMKKAEDPLEGQFPS